ncbi:MAG: M1 family aminopeptidase [Bacteroidota bacterium]
MVDAKSRFLWATGRAAIDAAPPNAPFDVLNYSLDISAAMVDERLGGRNVITVLLRTAADSVVLHQLKLQIDSVRVDGAMATFAVNDPAERLTIRLGQQRSAGDTLRIAVWYRRVPGIQRLTSRLGYYFFLDTLPGLPANLGYTMSEPRDARCWMPCFDEPWDKATASIDVTVPDGFVAASNGRLAGATLNSDGTVTWRWQETHQVATYLMCATISRWTTPTLPFVRTAGDTIPVQYFAWQADSAVTSAYLPTVRQMIQNLSARFGPYPWDKYAMASVTPFGYGGMEHQTITTIHRIRQTDEGVVVHELAHQWWGDLVTCGSWPDIWLNESFATYAEALWQESLGGFPALKSAMSQKEQFNFGSWSGAVYDPEGQGFGLFPFSVYSKGAWVLHTMRGVIGDSAFFGSLRSWRELYGEQSAVTADFQAVVSSVSGRDMSRFFQQWIYSPGWPVYSLSSRWQGGTLFVKIHQQQTAGWPVYVMPVHVGVYGPGLDTAFVLQDSLREQTFTLPVPLAPDSVRLDPDNWILKQRGKPVNEDWHEIPATYLVHQNFPNPFNGGTTISFDLPAVSRVRLQVYDLLGREVALLVDGVQLAGNHIVTFDAAKLASGIYLYRLSAGEFSETRKMIVLR